jgi:hypothetical protein
LVQTLRAAHIELDQGAIVSLDEKRIRVRLLPVGRN